MRARHTVRNGYQILDWADSSKLTIFRLWQLFPELVIGKHLVNTSFDSGFLTLSETERRKDWRMVGNLAHTSPVEDIDEIPFGHFDEWLIFSRPANVSSFNTLVNYLQFTPVDFEWTEKIEEFWSQVDLLEPLNVIGQNYRVYLATKDEELAQRILKTDEAGSLTSEDAMS